MSAFEEDDALDEELMRAFASYEDENPDHIQSVESNSLSQNQNEPPSFESDDEPLIELNENTPSHKATTSPRDQPASSKPDLAKQKLEEKKARVLANIRKQESQGSSQFSDKFSGPKYYDVHSHFTLGNPKIPQDELKVKMSGKQNIRLSALKDKIRSHALSDINYVVFGVISKRYQPKQGNNGRSWCTFLVSDLQYCSLRLTVFHGDHVHLYREGEGVVVGVLNPNVKLEDEPVLSVSDPRCILVLGRCLEYGICQATTQKTGQRCQMPINRKMGDFCEFHITKAYRQSKSRRSQLQAAVPVEPQKERERRAKMIESNQNKFLIYNGKQRLYENNPHQNINSRSTKTRATMSPYTVSVNQNPGQRSSGSVASGIQTAARDLDISQENSNLLNPEGPSVSFEDLLKRPTLGALNLKRSQVEGDTESAIAPWSVKKRPAPESVSARDLINQHKVKVKSQSEPPKVKDIVIDLGGQSASNNKNLSARPRNDVLHTPSDSVKKVSKVLTLSELKRMKAVAKVSSPLSSHSASTSRRKEEIMKLVNANRMQSDEQKLNCEDNGRVSSLEECMMPKSKKQKTSNSRSEKENLIESVLKLKSKFSTQLDSEEREHEEKYFNVREKKEQIEERLASTKEMKVRAVTCRQCCYVAPSLAMKCKVENHKHTWSEETKRFFKCSDCKTRTISYRKYPTQPCSKCQGRRFDRTAMIDQSTSLPIHNIEYFKIADSEDFSNCSSSSLTL